MCFACKDIGHISYIIHVHICFDVPPVLAQVTERWVRGAVQRLGLQLILQHVEVGFPYVMGLQCIKILGIISFRKEA